MIQDESNQAIVTGKCEYVRDLMNLICPYSSSLLSNVFSRAKPNRAAVEQHKQINFIPQVAEIIGICCCN